MAAFDMPSIRLFVDTPLREGKTFALDKSQANYLLNVLRLPTGQPVLVFNGRDGEFMAKVSGEGKRAGLRIERQTRPQPPHPTLRWLFAPLKHARLDYMVQKAVEMGAGSIEPVMTRRTQVSRINHHRMKANVIEAAEQCGILALPVIKAEVTLARLIENWENSAFLIFCDESAPISDPLAALRSVAATSLAVLIGPEGGFDPAEREALLQLPNVLRLSLGPRILRADTAAVAALTLVQATLGDWRTMV